MKNMLKKIKKIYSNRKKTMSVERAAYVMYKEAISQIKFAAAVGCDTYTYNAGYIDYIVGGGDTVLAATELLSNDGFAVTTKTVSYDGYNAYEHKSYSTQAYITISGWAE